MFRRTLQLTALLSPETYRHDWAARFTALAIHEHLQLRFSPANNINDASLAANAGNSGGAVVCSSQLIDSSRFTGNDGRIWRCGYRRRTHNSQILYFESNSAIAKGGAAYINPFSGTKIYSNLIF